MKDLKNKVLHIRLSELEEKVIKDKADLLGLTLTEYVKECCIFNFAISEYIRKLHGYGTIKNVDQAK